jgi:hypothetical protein
MKIKNIILINKKYKYNLFKIIYLLTNTINIVFLFCLLHILYRKTMFHLHN